MDVISVILTKRNRATRSTGSSTPTRAGGRRRADVRGLRARWPSCSTAWTVPRSPGGPPRIPGERMDFSALPRPTADELAGRRNKITLPLAPLVVRRLRRGRTAALGRGLRHTGGRAQRAGVDPGWRARLSNEEMLSVLRSTGAVVCAAGDGLAPADRKLYALRDVTGTVEAIPVIRLLHHVQEDRRGHRLPRPT